MTMLVTAESFVDRRYAHGKTGGATSAQFVDRQWAMGAQAGRIVSAQHPIANRAPSDFPTDPKEFASRAILDSQAQREINRDDAALLRDLTVEYGFTWVDLARLLGVSVPAIRKWRLGGRVAPENHSNLAHLVAFACLLRDRGVNAAIWLSTPMLAGFTVAPKHVYTPTRAPSMLMLAGGGRDPRAYLDSVEPNWRERYNGGGYTVTRFDDGSYGVVSR